MGKSLKVLKLSASAFKTYEQCPRKYYYTYINKLPRKEWPHLRLGNFVHAVLEDFHNSLLKNPDQEWKPLLLQCCKARFSKYNLDSSQKEAVKPMLRDYLNLLETKGMPKVKVNEQGFSFNIEKGLLLRGYIDRIDYDKERQYHIVDYKGLATDTPIPTPNGWTTMGALKVGDQIFGSAGQLIKVTIKSRTYIRPCYKITLSDKSTITADNVHLWKVGYRGSNGYDDYDEILNTDTLYSRFCEIKSRSTGDFIIENPEPLQLPKKKLPIDPWLLGAWLGKGLNKAGEIIVKEEDLLEMETLLKGSWEKLTLTKEKDQKTCCLTCVKQNEDVYGHSHCKDSKTYYSTCTSINSKISPNKVSSERKEWTTTLLRENLSKANLLDDKHIPKEYLRASIDQRQALLQGLMDTAGLWHSAGNKCIFISDKENIAKSVVELVRTFGIKVLTFSKIDKRGNRSYYVEFTPSKVEPFRLPRKIKEMKASLKVDKHTHTTGYRKIKNIELTKTVPTQCISVDAPDSLYVCGHGLTLSHNTGKSKYLDEFQLLVYGLYLRTIYPDLKSFRGSYLVLAEGAKMLSNTFTTTDLDRCEDKIKKVANKIKTDRTWETKKQFLCNYCDFKGACPVFTKADIPKETWIENG